MSPRVGHAAGDAITVAVACPSGIAVDALGNFFVADSVTHTIHKATPARRISRFAGIPFEAGADDGPGVHATFNAPLAIAFDRDNNLYVADSANSTIRKVTAAGVVSTLAGLAGRAGSADGFGPAARFFLPSGIATDLAGSLYVADAGNHNIRKISPTGVVTTLAGAAGLSGSVDGPGAAARFDTPYGIAVATDGVVYIADQGNSTVRILSPHGVVSTLAGLAGETGDSDGLAAAARFFHPRGIAVDAAGNVYVADTSNNAIRRISPLAAVTTIAAAPMLIGFLDGPLPNGLNRPVGLAWADDTLLVCDTSENLLTSIDLR